MGLDDFYSALDVYARKFSDDYRSGELNPDIDPATAGLIHEPAIARACELKLGVKLVEPEPLIHAKHRFMSATLDRASTSKVIHEMKMVDWTKADHWGESGTDHVPTKYMIQAQQQLEVGASHGYCADYMVVFAMIGREYRYYPIQRNDTIINAIVESDRNFVELLNRREPPEPDYKSAEAYQTLQTLYRPFKGPPVELPDSFLATILELEDWREAGSTAEKQQKRLKAELLGAAKGAGSAVCGDVTVTFTTTHIKEAKPREFDRTDIRVKRPKGAK